MSALYVSQDFAIEILLQVATFSFNISAHKQDTLGASSQPAGKTPKIDEVQTQMKCGWIQLPLCSYSVTSVFMLIFLLQGTQSLWCAGVTQGGGH